MTETTKPSRENEVEQELGTAYETFVDYVARQEDVPGNVVANYVRIGSAMCAARVLLREINPAQLVTTIHTIGQPGQTPSRQDKISRPHNL